MTAREEELLRELETIRRRKERLTIAAFLKRMGYKSRSSLRHFPTLREELHRYCGMGGRRRHLEGPSAERALRAQLAARDGEVARLRAALDAARTLGDDLRAEKAACRAAERDRDRLRGMVSALVAQIAQKSVVRARGLEDELLRAAQTLVPGLPDEVPEADVGPAPRMLAFPNDREVTP